MTDQEIVAKIEAYLVKNDLRQYELAKKMGIPESTLNRWLKRKTKISNAYRALLKTQGIIWFFLSGIWAYAKAESNFFILNISMCQSTWHNNGGGKWRLLTQKRYRRSTAYPWGRSITISQGMRSLIIKYGAEENLTLLKLRVGSIRGNRQK